MLGLRELTLDFLSFIFNFYGMQRKSFLYYFEIIRGIAPKTLCNYY